ncbi:MAG: PEP/pyruvate-binding domain-containing protein [Xanthomonadales bacterium]
MSEHKGDGELGTDAVSWFRDIGIGDSPQVGGKGASLGELVRAGIRVPAGFVVTIQAYDQFMDLVDKSGAIRKAIGMLNPKDLDRIKVLSGQFKDLFAQTPLPATLRKSIAGAYRELCGGQSDLPVAVRSSATCEDSAEASFAGLQDTYLWIRGEASVVKWVRACWASLYNPESVSYRLRLSLPEDQISMGVVVQEMVNARCSGVMFSRSPTTGDRSVVTLEASWGLGSSIVSGEVTPDKYVMNKVTGGIIDRVVATKLIQHVPDPSGTGVQEQSVPPEKQTEPCLSDDEVKALLGVAKKTELHYGCAQDMEWAIAHEDEGIWLLQSRPETVWSSKQAKHISVPQKKAFEHVFSALSGKQN